MYRKMLVLLDGSELAEVVLPFAKELTASLDLEVSLLLVYGAFGREFVPAQRAYIEQAAERRIQRHTAFIAAGVVCHDHELVGIWQAMCLVGISIPRIA